MYSCVDLRMFTRRVRILGAVLGCFVSACGGSPSAPSTPSAPSPRGSSGYAGQWSGTTTLVPFPVSGITTQVAPVAFTVSADQMVTQITVGYGMNGCSGVKTFSNLNLAIATGPSLPSPPFPPSPMSPTGPGFGYGSAALDGTNQTQVSGWFTSDATAAGMVLFIDLPGCGSAVGNWIASKR